MVEAIPEDPIFGDTYDPPRENLFLESPGPGVQLTIRSLGEIA